MQRSNHQSVLKLARALQTKTTIIGLAQPPQRSHRADRRCKPHEPREHTKQQHECRPSPKSTSAARLSKAVAYWANSQLELLKHSNNRWKNYESKEHEEWHKQITHMTIEVRESNRSSSFSILSGAFRSEVVVRSVPNRSPNEPPYVRNCRVKSPTRSNARTQGNPAIQQVLKPIQSTPQQSTLVIVKQIDKLVELGARRDTPARSIATVERFKRLCLINSTTAKTERITIQNKTEYRRANSNRYKK